VAPAPASTAAAAAVVTSFGSSDSASPAAAGGAKRRSSVTARLSAVRRTTMARLPTMPAIVVRKGSMKGSMKSGSEREPGVEEKTKELSLGIDISHIYPFSSPKLFHSVLDVLLLLNCFYLALYSTNYVFIAREVHNQALCQVLVLRALSNTLYMHEKLYVYTDHL
jgi:hypothetical protein